MSQEIKELWHKILSWLQDLIVGFGSSIGFSMLMHELLHSLSVIFTSVVGGILTTWAVREWKKYLVRKDKKNEES